MSTPAKHAIGFMVVITVSTMVSCSFLTKEFITQHHAAFFGILWGVTIASTRSFPDFKFRDYIATVVAGVLMAISQIKL